MRRFQLARRGPAACVGVLGPDRAEAGTAEQAGNFDAASPTDPRYNFANLDRVVQSAVAPRPQGDDLDHHAGAALGDRKPEQARPPVEAEARRVRPVRARGRSALRAMRRTSSRSSTSRTSPVGSSPQSNKRGFYAPHHYRRLVNAAFPAIRAASPGDDDPRRRAGSQRQREPRAGLLDPAARVPARVRLRVALVPQGPLGPAAATSRRRALTRSATTRTSSSSRPRSHSRNRDDAAIGDGPRLLRFLDRLVGRGRLISARGGKLDVHYTEFGYQTDPPDPYAGISLQASGPLAPGGGADRVGDARACTRSASSGSRTARSCPVADSPPTGSSRPGCCSTTCARSPRTRPSATRSSSSAAASGCACGARSAPAAATRSRSSASRRGGWKQVATAHDDPPRLLAAQDPQALAAPTATAGAPASAARATAFASG